MEWSGLVLSNEPKNDLISVSRKSDPVMSIELGLEEVVVNIMCAYAPQVACIENEKESLWELTDQELSATQDGDSVIVGGDLN